MAAAAAAAEDEEVVVGRSEVHVMVGSYEHMLVGFRCELLLHGDGVVEAGAAPERRFSVEAHANCVTALAAAGDVFATGSVDELVKVYDAEQKIEMGTLMEHQATITALEFHGDSHLLSADDGGLLAIWDTSTWTCLKRLRGHKGGIHDLSIHPSGQVALSVGQDRSLRTWNLASGRMAYVENMPEPAHLVCFATDGTQYALAKKSVIEVCATDGSSAPLVIEVSDWTTSLQLLSHDRVVVGGYGETVRLLSTLSGQPILVISGHQNRIRSLRVFRPFEGDDSVELLATASSDSHVKIWRLPPAELELEADEEALVMESDDCILDLQTHSRITCLAIAGTPIPAMELDDSPGPENLPPSPEPAPAPKPKAKAKHSNKRKREHAPHQDNDTTTPPTTAPTTSTKPSKANKAKPAKRKAKAKKASEVGFEIAPPSSASAKAPSLQQPFDEADDTLNADEVAELKKTHKRAKKAALAKEVKARRKRAKLRES